MQLVEINSDRVSLILTDVPKLTRQKWNSEIFHMMFVKSLCNCRKLKYYYEGRNEYNAI
jgi:hypothetical protein